VNVAKVIVDVPSSTIDQTFDYLIPDKFIDILTIGMRVIIPFGPRKIMGFVVEITDKSDFAKLKPILEVLDVFPVLTKELLDLGKWLAQETLSLSITSLQVMLPQVLKSKYKKEIRRLEPEIQSEKLEDLFQGQDVIPFEAFEQSEIGYHELKKAVDRDEIIVDYIVQSKITKKYITMVAPNKEIHLLEEVLLDLPKSATKQRAIIEYFLEGPKEIPQKRLLEQIETTSNTVNALVKKGILKTERKEVYRNPYDDDRIERTEALTLTSEQEQAITPILESIEKAEHDVFLVHGVTGSGKTEIYLQAIQEVINKGQEAIVLVPEISLTPQMVKRFKGRFGKNVAVMHSALSAGEKFDEWRKIQRKEVQVVVGARSAVFSPFENLGIIIIDEEHETSYKQEDQPRYHARDVAIKRGETNNFPIVLGSATPMLESYARAQKDVYKLTTLRKRTNNKPLPKVVTVDMRNELHAGNRTMFSRMLMEKIRGCLERREQIVLLLNRRGYSTFIMCRDCGHVKECPHCDIALTYHKNNHRIKCHYCSYEEVAPSQCPECASELIRYFGTGTQRIEESLATLLPEARVIRMDVDTTRRKGAHEKLLRDFADKKGDILLGTQMIAKGLDFENVTLVGVLTADSMLHLPDFRSSEKTFQLLTQVSGRAGRHELDGEVIVQTYTPEHYSIEMASNYDFEGFYKREMATRRAFQYPPYYFLALITITHPNHVKVVQAGKQIAQMLENKVEPNTVILGPTPSPIPRIKDRYRYQCMIKYKHEPDLRKNIQSIMTYFKDAIQKHDLQVLVDMQPYQMM
jgi:primosomal protein N' (replication factor Y)